MNFYKYTVVSSFSGFVLALDQVSKIYVHTQMKVGESLSLVKGFFDITYVRNPGGAFGLFKDSPDYVRYCLFFILPVICIFIIFKLLQETQDKYQITAFGFILGGAFGNCFDRIRLNYVIDFIDWHIKDLFHWPIFNIADIFIVIGITILATSYFLEKKPS